MSLERHHCESFAKRVSSAIVNDREIPAQEIEKARSCERCRTIMSSVAMALTADEGGMVLRPGVERRASSAAGRAARRNWRLWSGVRILLAVTFGLGFFFAWKWFLWRGEPTGTPFEFPVISTPLILWLLYLGAVRRDRGDKPSRLYCRWKRRWLEGVCVGLSEYFQVPLWVPRTAFIALALLHLVGVSAYLAVGIGLTFHPDDRQYMLRFRLRRFFRRPRGVPSSA